MVLQSGVRPYCFDYPVPYSIQNNPSGLIGFLLEQAMWIAVAEKRRLQPDTLADYDIFKLVKYTPPGLNATFEFFEPTPEGTIFGKPMGDHDPLWAGAVLDYIVDTRSAVRSVISSFDCVYADDEIEADFLNGWYPGSSGQVYLYSPNGTVSGPHAREEIQLPTTGFPPDEVPTEVCSLDVNSLGGSGILLDRDFGELHYNPYPWIAERVQGSLADGIGFNSDFKERATIVAQPVFPNFQKTGGTLITVNSRENTNNAAWSPPSMWTPDEVALGYVRIDGDNFFVGPDSEVMIGSEDMYDTNTWDTTFVSHFTPISTSSRTRNIFIQTQIVPDGSMFCNPGAKSYGSYRIAIANRVANFPNTTIESGVISTYPEPSGFSIAASQLRDTVTQQRLLGYEAFDEGFWVNEGSGLALISPLSGRCMWVRPADDGAAEADEPLGGGWQGSRGLQVVGGSIYKLGPLTVNGETIFLEFDEETLDYVGGTTGQIGVPGGGPSLTIEDFTYDGTDFWVLDSGASASEVYQFNGSTFALIQEWEATSAGFNLNWITWIPSKSKFYVKDAAFGSTAPIQLLDVSFPPASSVPTTGTSKPIVNFLGPAIRDIYDMVEVTTATQIDNGIYALCNISGVIGGGAGYINDVGIIRIEEVGNEWLVRSQQVIQSVNFRRTAPESRNVNFRFRAVP